MRSEGTQGTYVHMSLLTELRSFVLRVFVGVLPLLALLSSANAVAQPWASCPSAGEVNTGTAFGAPHLLGYSGSVTPELLQTTAFVALTLPEQRRGVYEIVSRRLQANGVRFDEKDLLALANHAIRGIDTNARARGLLYGLITGPLGGSYSPTAVPGIFRRTDDNALFARDAVELDARECVLWPILDKLIQSPCETTAGSALYVAARANPEARRVCVPPPSPSAGLRLTSVRKFEGGGLKVSIDNKAAKPGMRARFRVWRAASETVDARAQQIWSGEGTIMSEAVAGRKGTAAALYAIVARGIELAPEPSRPFLLVDAEKSPPVSCEQPSTTWELRHREPAPIGLHGPYAVTTVEDVVRQDAAICIAFQNSKALGFTDKDEYGFVILRAKNGSYYTTPPIKGSKDLKISWRDYAASIDKAFERSCENKPDFTYAADVHTHPGSLPPPPSDFFSPTDFNHGIQLKKGNPAEFREEGGALLQELLGVRIAYEKGIVVNTRKAEVYWFEPKAADRLIDDPVMADLFPPANARWTEYRDRSRPIGVACVK
jgi:hypothetical protein